MPTDETYTPCPLCREPVDPDGEGVVYAVELTNIPAFGQEHDLVEDRKGFFHPQCSPERIGWRRRDRPTAAH